MTTDDGEAISATSTDGAPGASIDDAPGADATDEGESVDVSDVGNGGDAPRRTLVAGMSSERLAAVVFGAYLVVAFFLLVFVYGDGFWFGNDEWSFLVDSSLSDPGRLIAPRNSHWSTVPTVIYQIFYRTFGLGTYLPYQIGVALLHLTLATLIRVVMRRAGVGPWVATVVAGTFVLFGAGYQNSLWGVQISMVGSMVCGFAHLILADHDGPFDRRDAIGLALGAVGLMSSGIAPPLVIVVGIGVFIRRGWLMAALHTAPLAALYGLWWATQRSAFDEQTYTDVSFKILSEWISTGETGVLMALGHYRPVAIALGVLLVGGLALAWIPLTRPELRKKAAAPAALLLGAMFLFGLVGTQRWVVGLDFARSSRYVAMGAALTLPALAVAADAVIRRWRVAAPVVLGLFLIGIIPGLSKFDDGFFRPPYYAAQKRLVLGAAHSPLLDVVDGDVQLDPSDFSTDELDVEFLRDARDSGLVPDLDEPLPPATAAMIDTRLALAQSDEPLPDDVECRAVSEPFGVKGREGDVFGIGSNVVVTVLSEDPDATRVGVDYTNLSGSHLEVQVPKLRFRVSPPKAGSTFTWCD